MVNWGEGVPKLRPVYIPSDVHRRFKAACANREMSMQDVMVALIEEFIAPRPNGNVDDDEAHMAGALVEA